MSKQTFRQGDVMLVKLKEKPTVGYPVAEGHVVLALGETTGHAHVIDGAVTEFRTQPGDRVVWLEAPAELRHVANGRLTGEHDTIKLQRGWYVVNQQVELADDYIVRQVYD